jgi:hypothetical protein
VAALTPAFFDTSILVAGLIEIGEASEYPQRIMTAIAAGQIRKAVTAWHCCLEFSSVATRLPEEFRLAPEDALRLIEQEVLARFEVRQLPEQAREPFLRALEHERVVGGRVYDAHIAENRRHFLSLARHGIRVLGPRSSLEQAASTRERRDRLESCAPMPTRSGSSTTPGTPGERKLSEALLTIARRLESRPWNRQGSDRTWVLVSATARERSMRAVRSATRVDPR